jgi:adenosylmethionine---8-amino-7-oxononanoate aminotransferase
VIDVEGNRYFDAISSLWVTTLGHRVPELDQAVRDQLDRVAHTTLLGNGNRIVIELAEALAPRVPVDRPRFLFASDGAAAVEQALKIAFQFWTNQGVTGRHRYLAFGGAYHGDTIGSLAVGDGGFGTDVFDPLRFDVLRCPTSANRAPWIGPWRSSRTTPRPWRPWCSSRSCRAQPAWRWCRRARRRRGSRRPRATTCS